MNQTAIFMKMYRDHSCRCPLALTGEEFVVSHKLGKVLHPSIGIRIRSFARSLPVLL